MITRCVKYLLKGTKGDTGLGIKSEVCYYSLSKSSTSHLTITTSMIQVGWTTTPQTPTAEKPYHWKAVLRIWTDETKEIIGPEIIGTYGEKGDKGDKGDSGQTSVVSYVFCRYSRQPQPPTSDQGSYAEPNPPSSGWSVTSGSDTYVWTDAPEAKVASSLLWMSRRTFTSDGEDPQGDWTEPILMADTANFDVEYSALEYPGDPNENPEDWSDDPTDAVWMATKTRVNGVWEAWTVVRIKGEQGEQGEKGDKGDKGSRGPALRGPQAWEDMVVGYSFQCGADAEDYKDCVVYDSNYYSCVKSHKKTATNYPGSTEDVNNKYWQLGDKVELIATNILLAAYALIKNLGVEAIEMKDNLGTIIFQAKDGVVTCNTGTFNNVTVQGNITAATMNLKLSTVDTGVPNGSICYDVSDVTLQELQTNTMRVIKIVNPVHTRSTPVDLILTCASSNVQVSTGMDVSTCTIGSKMTVSQGGYNAGKYYELLGYNNGSTTTWILSTLESI